MGRYTDYTKKTEKIKVKIDELVEELIAAKELAENTKPKLKISEINFDDEELGTLLQIQAKLSKIILEKSK